MASFHFFFFFEIWVILKVIQHLKQRNRCQIQQVNILTKPDTSQKLNYLEIQFKIGPGRAKRATSSQLVFEISRQQSSPLP